jgi:hypothetical protein
VPGERLRQVTAKRSARSARLLVVSTKYGELANFIPHDVNDLAQEVATSLIAKHDRQEFLNAFFQHARLDL